MKLTGGILIELRRLYKENKEQATSFEDARYWQGRYDAIFDIHERFEFEGEDAE